LWIPACAGMTEWMLLRRSKRYFAKVSGFILRYEPCHLAWLQCVLALHFCDEAAADNAFEAMLGYTLQS
ncbi:MAG: hypothetical protein Q4G28_09915, partial [Neisseria sp.]|nr:hypothetical protein [Neisseria sp.]